MAKKHPAQTTNSNPKDRLSFGAKISYGASDFGNSMAHTVAAFFLLIFLTDVVRLSPVWAGTLVLITKLWEALVAPMIGYMTSRTWSRWGRYRPFLLWFSLPFGLFFGLIWSVPQPSDPWLRFLLMAGLLLCYITSFELIQIPYASLAPELVRDYDERTRLNGYRMFFSLFGSMAAMVLPARFFSQAPDLHQGYRMMGLCFGILIALLPLISFLGTQEGRTKPEPREAFFKSFGITFKNRPFLLSLAAYLAAWAAIDVITALLLYFLKYHFGIREENCNLVFGIVFAAAILFLPFWVSLSNRFGKRAAFLGGMGFLAASQIALALAPANHSYLIYWLAPLGGIGIASIQVIPLSMIPDAVEFDELNTGRRREGIYFGVLTFMYQLVSAMALYGVSLVLQFSGYRPEVAQSPVMLRNLRLMVGGLPVFFFIIVALALCKYPINRSSHHKVARELDLRGKG
ncbi:MAG: MFS transporter [Firmicutes bacterium]|nr:MFS transporter [Bacillota bacterium]